MTRVYSHGSSEDELVADVVEEREVAFTSFQRGEVVLFISFYLCAVTMTMMMTTMMNMNSNSSDDNDDGNDDGDDDGNSNSDSRLLK